MDSQEVLNGPLPTFQPEPESGVQWPGSRFPSGRRLDPGFRRGDGCGDILQSINHYLNIKFAFPSPLKSGPIRSFLRRQSQCH